MKAIDLYRFIEDNGVEWHRYDDDVLIFPRIYEMADFHKLLSPSIFDDEGIEVKLKDGYFAIWMKDICEYHGIEMDDVFKGKEGNC